MLPYPFLALLRAYVFFILQKPIDISPPLVFFTNSLHDKRVWYSLKFINEFNENKISRYVFAGEEIPAKMFYY